MDNLEFFSVPKQSEKQSKASPPPAVNPTESPSACTEGWKVCRGCPVLPRLLLRRQQNRFQMIPSFPRRAFDVHTEWVMLSIVQIQGCTREKLLPTSMWRRSTLRCDLKWSSFSVYCLAVFFICLFCYSSSGESSVFLLTMQSLFMIIDMLSYWFLLWCLCLSEKKKLIYHRCNVEILQIGNLCEWTQLTMHLTVIVGLVRSFLSNLISTVICIHLFCSEFQHVRYTHIP